MDPEFLKWMSQSLSLMASNLEIMEKWMKMFGQGGTWFGSFPAAVGLPPAPFPDETMQRLNREWLSLFGAVPRKDYDELAERLKAMEAQCEELKRALESVVAGMAGVGEMPEALKPWLELADQAAKAHLEWFADFKKSWDEARDALAEGAGKNVEKGGD